MDKITPLIKDKKYTLEYLSNLFEEHSREFSSNPHNTQDDFDLPLALKLMVDELIVLRGFKRAIEDKIMRDLMIACASKVNVDINDDHTTH